jgi:phage N-6-adenine-methyltransferase
MSLVGFKITNHPQQVGKRGASDSVDERITPDHIFKPLTEEFKFDLDAAANARNSKTYEFYSKDSPFGDGLSRKWGGRVWCNPPYSDIRPWVEKAWAEYRSGSCDIIAMLLPANRCEQGWWQDLIEPFRDGRGPLETRFYRGRFNFGLPDNPEGKFHSSPPFGCVLVIWRTECGWCEGKRDPGEICACNAPEAQGMPREARRREGGSGPSGLASPIRDSECAQTPSPNLSQGDTP